MSNTTTSTANTIVKNIKAKLIHIQNKFSKFPQIKIWIAKIKINQKRRNIRNKYKKLFQKHEKPTGIRQIF